MKNIINPFPQMKDNLEELKNELKFLHFKKKFLLRFTRELIRHSTHAEMIKLQTIVEKEQTFSSLPAQKERIKQIIRKKQETEEENAEFIRSIMHPSIGMFESQGTPENNLFRDTFNKELQKKPQPVSKPLQSIQTAQIRKVSPQPYQDPFRKIELWIPEPRLPPHIQYLRPTPVNKNLDLVKLNPLVNDPRVSAIECYGPNENIGVKGAMGAKKTGIILTKEDIDSVIEKFSKETKIPVQEGVYKVVSGKLILLAIISSVTGAKFTITKMPPERQR